MSDTPMKERLARILDPIAWSDRYKPDDRAHAQQHALATVAAILREMLEPSDEMLKACSRDGHERQSALMEDDRATWQTMLQHTIDEGTVVHTAASSVLHDSNRSKSAKVAAGLSLTQRSKRR